MLPNSVAFTAVARATQDTLSKAYVPPASTPAKAATSAAGKGAQAASGLFPSILKGRASGVAQLASLQGEFTRVQSSPTPVKEGVATVAANVAGARGCVSLGGRGLAAGAEAGPYGAAILGAAGCMIGGTVGYAGAHEAVMAIPKAVDMVKSAVTTAADDMVKAATGANWLDGL